MNGGGNLLSWVIGACNKHVGNHKFVTITETCLKSMLSRKATKNDEIFTVDLTLCSKCQIDGEDFINFCGLLRKHELYLTRCVTKQNVLLNKTRY